MPPLRRLPLAAAMLAIAAPALAGTSPVYRGLVYLERPVVAVPVLAGVAVNTLTGNLVLGRGLFTVPARGIPLEAFLVYNSDRRKVASPFGRGWSLSYGLRYVEDASGNVRIVWGDGRVDLFLAAGGGTFTSPAGVFATLSRPAPGQLLLRTKRGLEYRFFAASHRKLTAIADRNGNTLTLTYDGGRLVRLSDAAGRQWDLAYDGQGRLVELSDPNLPRSVAFVYDAFDRLVQLTDPLGESESYGYGTDDLLTSITDRRGNQAVIAYTGGPGNRLVASVAKGGSTTMFAYDAGSRTTTLTDPNGNPWMHTYSGSNLLTSVTDPLGESETFVWGTDKVLLERTDRRGTASTYDYDAKGNLTKATVPLAAGSNAVTTVVYNQTCQRPLSILSPRGGSWQFVYDAACNLTKVTDPAELGTQASLAYDAFGQPMQRTDRSGRVTTYTHDAAGNPTSATNALGHAWEYAYDGAGRLVAAEDPLGHQRTYEYDALDRLVTATDALGHDATYEYDEAGNLLRYTDREGNQTQASYDALGRLAGTTDALGNSDSYVYDAAGNPTSYLDRRGNTWMQAFNARGEITSRTNPLGGVWSSTYDANGNLATHTDAKGQVTTFTYDLANRLIQRDSADTSRTTYSYDAHGNLLTALDRLTPGGTITSNLSFLYNANDFKTRSSDNLLGRNVRKSWDGDGRQLTETDAIGNVTSYQYDAAGRLTKITAYGGTATFTLDAAGNPLLDQRSNGVSTAYTYDANGRVATLTSNGPAPPPPGGLSSLDPGGPVLSSFAYTNDGNGDIVAALRGAENVAFTRDPLRRILTEQGTLGGAYTQSFTYDENGNRLSSTLAKAAFTRVISETFDAAGRAVGFSNLFNGTGPTAVYTLDANGARTLAAYSGGSSTSYTYNARGLLTGFDAGGSTTATYPWDALDRLYGRSSASGSLRFLYGSGVVSAVEGAGLGSTPAFNISSLPDRANGAGYREVRLTNIRAARGLSTLPMSRSIVELAGLTPAQAVGGQPCDTRSIPGLVLPPIPQPRRVISVDLGGTRFEVLYGGSYSEDVATSAANPSGVVASSRQPYSDVFFNAASSSNFFTQVPPLTDPQPGSNAFSGDQITFYGGAPYDSATRSSLAGKIAIRPEVRYEWRGDAATVNGSFAPLSTAVNQEASAPIPRFVDPSARIDALRISTCRTNLLFPFVTNQAGFDTGLALPHGANDPLGARLSSGSTPEFAFDDFTMFAVEVVNVIEADTLLQQCRSPKFSGWTEILGRRRIHLGVRLEF